VRYARSRSDRVRVVIDADCVTRSSNSAARITPRSSALKSIERRRRSAGLRSNSASNWPASARTCASSCSSTRSATLHIESAIESRLKHVADLSHPPNIREQVRHRTHDGSGAEFEPRRDDSGPPLIATWRGGAA